MTVQLALVGLSCEDGNWMFLVFCVARSYPYQVFVVRHVRSARLHAWHASTMIAKLASLPDVSLDFGKILRGSLEQVKCIAA